MEIEIIITESGKQVVESLNQLARAQYIECRNPTLKITQRGLCLTPRQYKAVYKKIEEIKQILR